MVSTTYWIPDQVRYDGAKLMGQQLIETPRLSLRPFATIDQENIFLLYGDPDVMAIRKIGTQTKEGSGAQLQITLDHWGRKGFGLWAVYVRQTNEFMGECGLRERYGRWQ